MRLSFLTKRHLLFLTTGRFLTPNGEPFGVPGLRPDRLSEGEDVDHLTPPCPDTIPPVR
jgi:hypothetical protein